LPFNGQKAEIAALSVPQYLRESGADGRHGFFRAGAFGGSDSVRIEVILNAARRAAVVFAGLALVISAGFVAPALAQTATPAALTGAPIEGTWRTLNGTEITITPCDAGYCGVLSWVLIPKANADQCRATDHTAFASLMMDYKNPDKAQQTRPILGLTMLKVKPSNDPHSFNASVYNPEDGSTNDVQVFILNNDKTLKIGGGCIGTICVQSQDWPRVPDREGTPDFSCDGGQ
jgi:uncharacterized protein (DUF2147 family)